MTMMLLVARISPRRLPSMIVDEQSGRQQQEGGRLGDNGGEKEALRAVCEGSAEGDFIGHIANEFGLEEEGDGAEIAGGYFQHIPFAHQKMQDVVLWRVLPDGFVVGGCYIGA